MEQKRSSGSEQLSSSTTKQLRAASAAALSRLGSTFEEVAVSLKRLGFLNKGKPKSCEACPVALYLRNVTHSSSVTVTSVRAYAAAGDLEGTALPAPVLEFVRRYDGMGAK